MIVLRDYQIEALESVWGEMFKEQYSLFTGSTGLGKTEIAIGLFIKAIKAKPSVKILFAVNKLKLLEQTARRLNKELPSPVSKFYGKEKSTSGQVVVGSIQSLLRIKDPFFNIIFLDEVHNVDQEKGVYYLFIQKAIKANPKVRIVACTATPFRSTGYIYGKDNWFKRICFSRGLLWSIKHKHLVRPSCKRVNEKFDTHNLKISMGDYDNKALGCLVSDTEKVIAQVKDALTQLEGRKSVVWACVNIDHAMAVQKILGNAAIVHSKQHEIINNVNLQSFETGTTNHLVFVSIVSEGYDHPPIDAVVLMRPTRSAVLYVQTVGRGLRPSPGKKDCLVLDYGGVIENCGPLHSPYITQVKSAKKGVVDIKMKFCKNCYEYCELSAAVCPACETPFPKPMASTKNLTEKSYDGSIMGARKFSVKKIHLSYYESKAGNNCIKVEYISGGIVGESVSEFFTENKPWAINKLEKRLRNLGIKAYAIPSTREIICGELELVKNGKYWNVK